jgi:hypothetical protein
MGSYTQFGTATNLPDTGSIFAVGTAALRVTPGGLLAGGGLLGLGKCQSIQIKSTGEIIELEDEEAATEAMLRLNPGDDVTIKARFTKDVPAPKPFMFLAVKRRTSVLTAADGSFTDTPVAQHFLITEVSEDYGSKAVATYDLTARRWDSLTTGSRTATVTTATGAITSGSGTATPAPAEPD